MPDVSRAEQQFMGIASHHPEMLRGTAPNMTRAKMRDFATTPIRGLPPYIGKYAAGGLVTNGQLDLTPNAMGQVTQPQAVGAAQQPAPPPQAYARGGMVAPKFPVKKPMNRRARIAAFEKKNGTASI